jgi:hypothetical protein
VPDNNEGNTSDLHPDTRYVFAGMYPEMMFLIIC